MARELGEGPPGIPVDAPWSQAAPVHTWALGLLSLLQGDRLLGGGQRVREEAAAFQPQLLLKSNKEILSLWNFISFPSFAWLEEASEVALPIPVELAGPHSCKSLSSGVREAGGRMRVCIVQACGWCLAGPL